MALASDQDVLQLAVDMYKLDHIGNLVLLDKTIGEIKDILIRELGITEYFKCMI